jgi:TonB family protein
VTPVLLVARSSILLVAALAACALARGRSAAWRHALLSAGVVGALVVGPLSWLMPGIPLAPPIPLSDAITQTIVGTADGLAGSSARSTALDLSAWLWLAWLAGVVLRSTGLARSLHGLHQSRRAAPPAPVWAGLLPAAAEDMGVPAPAIVTAPPGFDAPAVWGFWRPVILAPDDAGGWSQERVRMVLLHELAHVARRDWAVQMLAELLILVYWFNPLAFLVRRRLRRESEQACDDLVLTRGVRPAVYGATLAALARRHLGHRTGALPMAHPSSLERRIAAMLDPSLNRGALTRRVVATCATLALCVTVPVAALRLLAQEEARGLAVQVFDPSGAVLPGVTLELEAAGQAKQTTTTEGSGRGVWAEIPPGDYTLGASLIGFRTLRTPISIEGARDRQRSITLQVGELVETITVRERRPAPSTASPTAVVEPLRIGGNIRVPKKLTDVRPAYPPAMRDAGLEGTVPMEALIGRDGSVVSVRVLSADVHPEFARAAVEAVRAWAFSPTLLNDEAVEVRMTVSVRFSLEN